MAKAYAGEACLAAARRGHQIFGAISYCEEHPLHVFHKRIQAASLDFGDAALHLETVAQAIGLDVDKNMSEQERFRGLCGGSSSLLRPAAPWPGRGA